ncbi:extracellular solute-binding protein [Pleomorphomonas carboxyditropha]|uniref:ABC transporter substrate-binding protein n=1 Tax=Pleomorphomonas carboxyditropha TaxID=2023338 RepID=A0A2G9WSZ3_9HYPH|nr:extracellular solute-binding protein [Pleomorphomonas carboxyditropha]PIO97270.1 ABC transporter substrate-binding protein [Pleomorphomonas carboxyditropha]
MSYRKISVTLAVASAILASTAAAALARDVTVKVWSGGTGPTANYRIDAIKMAADLYQQEAAIRGEDIKITVEGQAWSGWDDFKQAVTLAGESNTAPNIIVSGHEDIGSWSKSGLLRPIEDYVDFDAWPLNQIYPNLIAVSSFDGKIWGIPQDAEARPFFFSKTHLRQIGYSDADIEALPAKVESGEYTLYSMLDDVKKMQDGGFVEKGKGFLPRPVNGTDYWQFYTSFGGEMVDEESGKLLLDTAALTGMYQFFVDAVDKGVVPATHLGSTWDSWHQAVAGDQVGAWHAGTWQKAEWETKWGLKDFFGQMQYSLIPAGNAEGHANTLTHPLVYLLSKAGSDEDAALSAELITIASEPRINALHAVKSGHLAIGEAEAAIPFYANDRWTATATEGLLPHAKPIPNDPNFGVVWKAMFKGLEASWTKTSSVADAVKAVETEVKTSLGDAIIIR